MAAPLLAFLPLVMKILGSAGGATAATGAGAATASQSGGLLEGIMSVLGNAMGDEKKSGEGSSAEGGGEEETDNAGKLLGLIRSMQKTEKEMQQPPKTPIPTKISMAPKEQDIGGLIPAPEPMLNFAQGSLRSRFTRK